MLRCLNSQLPKEMVSLDEECRFLAPWTVLMCFISYDFKWEMQQNRYSQGSTYYGNSLQTKTNP